MIEGGQNIARPRRNYFLLAYPRYGAGLYGRVAEWLKAPSLNLGAGVKSTCRGFESHPVRQTLEGI